MYLLAVLESPLCFIFHELNFIFHVLNQFEPHIEVTIFLDVRASEAYDNPHQHNRSDPPAARVEGLIF